MLGPTSYRARRAPWLLYGAVWGLLGELALMLVAPDPWPIQGSRAHALTGALSAVNHGAPLLSMPAPGGSGYITPDRGDDPGVYLLAPLLDHWLGLHDPVATLRVLYLVAWALPLIAYPVVFRILFRSRWAAIVSAPALLACILAMGFGDIYWVCAWAVLALVPVALVATRRWSAAMPVVLAAMTLVASAVSAIRSNAGLPVAAAATAAVLWAPLRRRSKLGLVSMLVVAYLAISPGLIGAIRAQRNHDLGGRPAQGATTGHVLWHSAFVGLGYTSNPYRIHYNDSDGVTAVREIDPGAGYVTPAYERALRRAVTAIAVHDPGFVAAEVGRKLVVVVADCALYLLLLIALLPVVLRAPPGRGLTRRDLAMTGPALALGLLPPLIAIPIAAYETGLLAALALLVLLGVGSAAAQLELAGPRSIALPRRATAIALPIAALLAVVVTGAARDVRAQHLAWDAAEPKDHAIVLPGNVRHSAATRRRPGPSIR